MQTTLIEAHLKAIDQATFQKMVFHLLFLEGYKFISSPGSVVGKNKTSKGSPDNFFEDGDNFIFCECTTQEKIEDSNTFINKLKADINHCFDKTKTGIEAEQISKVILAFTDKLKPAELQDLKKLTKGYNANCELITLSIQELPLKLTYYPGLAERYIPNVKTTNGTLFTLPDFIEGTTKGLQPSLANTFVGREEELKNAQELLKTKDILIISGIQGVGKSKLAIELAANFEKEGFEPRVIISSPVPLWEDFKSFIHPDKKYIVFFDDANKAIQNLDYLLQYIQDKEKDTIKVIITVRDYARRDLNRVIHDKVYNEISLKELEDKQIRELILKALPDGLSITGIELDRITTLAKGNGRLALMATYSIIQNSNFDILKNVAALYDDYFSKTKVETTFLNSKDNLKALGILSFFDVIDFKDEALLEILLKKFKIDRNNLWDVYVDLEKLELVDIFSNHVVKISDQVLATYVFYKTFIDKEFNLIPYSDWVLKFIDKYHKKIKKSLIDCINTFGYYELKDRMIEILNPIQEKLPEEGDETIKFYDIFWFYKETETLFFIKKWVENIEYESIDTIELNFTNSNSFIASNNKHLDVLSKFWRHSMPLTEEAVKIGLELAFRRPTLLPDITKALKDNFAYQRYDYKGKYASQHTLIDILTKEGYNEYQKYIVDNLFIQLAPGMIGWRYTEGEGRGGSITLHTFNLVKTSSLHKLRLKIIKHLDYLYKVFKSDTIDLIEKYISGDIDIDVSVYLEEQIEFSQVLKNNLSPTDYNHCKLINRYVKRLNEYGFAVIEDWSDYTNSNLLQIAKMFKFNYRLEEMDLIEKAKEDEIKELIKDKDIKYIEYLLDNVSIIYSNDNNRFDIDRCLNYMFNSLIDSDKNLFLNVLILLLQKGYTFNLNASLIINPLTKGLFNPLELYNLINRYKYPLKKYFKLIFFDAIAEEKIDLYFTEELIAFYQTLDEDIFITELSNYNKYNPIFNQIKDRLQLEASNHQTIVTYIVSILLLKEIKVSFGFRICEKNGQDFKGKVNLLKEIYFRQKQYLQSYDYDNREMMAIAELDPAFINEYLEIVTKDKVLLDFNFDHHDFSFIWELTEYKELIDKAMGLIISKAPLYSSWEHQANVFFKKLSTDEMRKRAYQFTSDFIKNNANNIPNLRIIMNVTTYSFPDQQLRFLREILLVNKDIELLDALWLEKSGVTTGSRVPKIEKHIEKIRNVIEMVKGLPSPLDYIEHIRRWESEIKYSLQEKEQELKNDFIGDYWE